MPQGRVQVTPEQVTHSLLEALRTALALDARQAWATVDPMVPISAIPPGGDMWATLAFGDLSFGFDEAGIDILFAQTEVMVTGYLRYVLDDLGHDEGFLLDADRGAWKVLRKIVKALHGVELLDDNGDPWCANLPQCTFASRPDYNWEHAIGWVQARFAISWDWGSGDA